MKSVQHDLGYWVGIHQIKKAKDVSRQQIDPVKFMQGFFEAMQYASEGLNAQQMIERKLETASKIRAIKLPEFQDFQDKGLVR